MNEMPEIKSLCSAQRVLGLPQGKQRKLIREFREREFSTLLQPFYQERIKAMLIRGQCKFLSK